MASKGKADSLCSSPTIHLHCCTSSTGSAVRTSYSTPSQSILIKTTFVRPRFVTTSPACLTWQDVVESDPDQSPPGFLARVNRLKSAPSNGTATSALGTPSASLETSSVLDGRRH